MIFDAQITKTLERYSALGCPVGPIVRGAWGSRSVRTESGMAFWSPLTGSRIMLYPGLYTLNNVIEFRDPFAIWGGKPGKVYRSAKLVNANFTDRMLLSHILHGGMIIDLRTSGRINKEPDPSLPDIVWTQRRLPPTIHVPYALIVQNHKAELRDILKTMAEQDGPFLVHCSEGKDRTGIVIALLMLACGASEAVAHLEYITTVGHDKVAWRRMIQAMTYEVSHPDPRIWIQHRQGLNLSAATVDALRAKVGKLG